MSRYQCSLCKAKMCVNIAVCNLYKMVKCCNCGLVFTHPLPTQKQLSEYYHGFEPIRIPEAWHEEWASKAAINIDMLLKNISRHNKYGDKRRFLDIGCSLGFFLKRVKERGWEEYGVDIDKQAVEIARNKYSLNVISGSLIDASFPDNYFDVILAKDVLEHVLNPVNFLEEVNRILCDDGIIILQMPNINSLDCYFNLAQIKDRFGRLKHFNIRQSFWKRMSLCFSKAWSWANPPRHLYCFSTENLQSLLNSTGFEVTKELSTFYGDPDYDPLFLQLRGWKRLYEIVSNKLLLLMFKNISFFKGRGRSLLVYARKSK